MNILVLGGNNVHNSKWVDSIVAKLIPKHAAKAIYYDHWTEPDKTINFELEYLKLVSTFNKMSNGQYIIVAKSAGILISLDFVCKTDLAPTHIICVGLPINFTSIINVNLEELLALCSAKTKVTLIQQTNDPEGSFNEVSKLCSKYENINCIEWPGSTHDYDAEELVKFVIESLK